MANDAPTTDRDAASVLVVDDSRLSAAKLAMAMRALGHRAEVVDNGAEALRRMRERPVDVVLLDIVMPGMDGYEVLRALKADSALRDVPVIVISSLDDEIGSVARAIELGAEDFLPKNFEPTILKARLDASLARKRFRDRELAYLRDVEKLTRAAQVIEAGAFRPTEMDVDDVASRRDALGRLADVFRGLAREIYERERALDLRIRTLRGSLLVLAAGGIFGIAPALGRMAGAIGVPPLGLALWANIVAAIACLGIAALRGGVPRVRAADLGFFALWAIVLGCLYQFLTVEISRHVEATMIALVGSSRGFMVFGLAALFALERPSLRRFIGLGLGFAAIMAVLLIHAPDQNGKGSQWLLAALALPFLLALHTLLMARRPKDIDAFATVGIMMAISAVLLAPIAHVSGAMLWPTLPLDRVDLIIVTLGVASGVALALALDLVATAGAVFASQMAYSQTLAGIIWGMLLLGEQLSPVAWGALGVVIVSFWLVQPKSAGDEFRARVPLSRP